MLNSPIDEIKNRLDIVEVVKDYVQLQKTGINLRGLCPFHSEKTPSFFVSPSRQTWHCFGSCGEGGDIFKFIMKIEGVEFGDALRVLAAKAGVQLQKQDPKIQSERKRIYEICEWATRFFERYMDSAPGKKAKEYLLGRNINEESVSQWRIGYAPNSWDGLLSFLKEKGYSDEEVEKAGLAVGSSSGGSYRRYDRFRGRIMFPIFDFNSQPIGFGGRIFDLEDKDKKEAKYINTSNTPIYDKSKTLYGLNKARSDIRKENACVLVEGYTDVIMSSQAGVGSVVATSGTALTSYQLDVLKRYSDNLITAFDMDVAGDLATKRGIDMAQEKGFNIKVAIMPDGLDPADLIAKDFSQWKEIIKEASSIISFYFQTAFSRFDSEVPENKKKIAGIILPAIKRIVSDIERDFWIQELAKKLKVGEEAIVKDLEKIKDGSGKFGEEKNENYSTEKEKKTRNNLLEERILILLSKKPETTEILPEDLSFLSAETCAIINHFKGEKQEDDKFPGITEKIDYLGIKSEIDPDPDNIEEEFSNCLLEIQLLNLREKLKNLSREIKKCEEQKDYEKAENLKKDFNLLCKKMAEIN